MYFPFLRGKQFELIALRELSQLMSENHDKISPIIEPVKDSSTLKSTLKDLSKKNINFNFIINPKEGDLNKPKSILTNVGLIKSEIDSYLNYQIAIIIDNKTNHQSIIEAILSQKLSNNKITLIHFSDIANIDEVLNLYSADFEIIYNVIYTERTGRRYHRNFDRDSLVTLDDYFQSLQKNSDYLNRDESNFSDEHLFYREDGFIGFSDFLTVGSNYSDSGFLPYAVAIHISYIADNNSIRIKHFVSDSNFDATDIAGKFSEALEKLIAWCNEKHLNTIAINKYRDLHNEGHFPGLGTLKKLSIMNHIELVLNLI